ncbi:MAG: DUF5717 family protein [Gemmataceae bacterium]|nr:DUF5717 family protein [Gemmataceae bacterium]MDW8266644.1 DUF5717 family protein [Gemmataceae bacterium]
MVKTCSRCSRVNPPEALYCYYDGYALGGNGQSPQSGPLNVAAQEFVRPFVFPNGQRCQTFDQLALACQKDWATAANLLRSGALETFFSGMGRADLGLAARQAARFPDLDQALDDFLAQLPTSVLQPPELRVEPTEINLGQIRVGEDRKLEIHLENKGMRLVRGVVTVENAPWLALGKPGTTKKHFQFGAEQSIPVLVIGKMLRASSKPLEGQLIVESNGGNVIVNVRAEVPAKPFPNGCLAGARSPRQLAEKAKANPKDAAVYFEKGAVLEWYKENGWVYPVRGPSASGLGAVQQFFEALGLTPPPKVEVSEKSITLQANPGDEVRHAFEVRTQEKRPVYAHAVSDSPWLEVGRARLAGRVATIPLAVPSVPNRPGSTLTAKVTVTSNGNQRFVIPVTLTIGNSFDFTASAPVSAAAGRAASVANAEPLIQSESYARVKQQQGGWIHLLPLVLLLISLGGVVIWEILRPAQSIADGSVVTVPGTPGDLDKNKLTGDEDLLDPRPRILIEFQREKRRFGIALADEQDPFNPARKKRLTYHENGQNNNTCLVVDNHEYLFGNQRSGSSWWVRDERKREQDLVEVRKGRIWKSIMEWADGIRVTQTVRIIQGESTRLLDTCLCVYEVENRSQLTRNVGLRVMLDTYIGSNDGVPFAIPGQPGLLDTMREFPQKDIPDFIQAFERADLQNPGTVAQIGLRLPGFEPPLKLLICHWPDDYGSEVHWKWPKVRAMNDPPENKDSCVVIYWAELPMAPKTMRRMAYTYGLGRITAVPADEGSTPAGTPAGQIGLTAGPPFREGSVFTAMAYVRNPQAGQSVVLRLPAGLKLEEGQAAEQPIDPKSARQGYTQVSWRVKAEKVGDHVLEADLKNVQGHLATARYPVRIKNQSIFD